MVELGFVADEKMESVEIEGGTTEFDAAGNGDMPGVGLAHGLNPSPFPVCCCCIGFVDDAFPLPLLKEGEERMFPKISEKMDKKIREMTGRSRRKHWTTQNLNVRKPIYSTF